VEHEIAPFEAADVDEVFALWAASEGIGLFGETPQRVRDCLARSPGLSFVARCGSVLAGAVLCTTDGRRGYLNHLAVARAHRRAGIGRALSERAMAAMAAQGIPKCHLFVWTTNAAAQAFWAELGWVVREDIVMMSKTPTPQD
jgi:ribosomal protein S18 acetylase RimI-like enzyme